MRNKKNKKVAKAVLAAAIVAPAVAATPISFDGGQNTAEASSSHVHFSKKHNNGKAHGHDKGNKHNNGKTNHDKGNKQNNGKAKGHHKADKLEKHLEKKADKIEKQLKKHSYNLLNRGASLLQLANKAVQTGEPTPVHHKGEVIGYVVAEVEHHPIFGKIIKFEFVKELPQSPVEEVDQPIEEEVTPEQPAEEVETPVEEEVISEQPAEEVETPVEEEVISEQPAEEVETPVEEENEEDSSDELTEEEMLKYIKEKQKELENETPTERVGADEFEKEDGYLFD